MDSINRNQPEDNREDLIAQDAIEKIKEQVDKSASCFFCTAVSAGGSGGSRPMSVQEVDSEGNLWFVSAVDSHKNRELSVNPAVSVFFQGSPHSDFMHLTGRATVSVDRKKIEELWDDTMKVWFTEGIDDPRITIIKFSPEGGYYWDTKHGSAVAYTKMLVGAVMGRTLDDSIEGTISVGRKKRAAPAAVIPAKAGMQPPT